MDKSLISQQPPAEPTFSVGIAPMITVKMKDTEHPCHLPAGKPLGLLSENI